MQLSSLTRSKTFKPSSSMSSSTLTSLFVPLLLGLPSICSAVTFDCDHVRVDGKSYNFDPIRGPHSVLVVDEEHPPAVTNTTWTVDLCAPLKENKDVPVEDTCPKGTRICGISVSGNEADKTIEVEHVIPIAGTFVHDGRNLDPKIKRIKASQESEGGQTGGLEVEFNGGKWGKRKQMAVIEFVCDSKRTGNEGNEKARDLPEGEEEAESLAVSGKELSVRQDDDNDLEDEKNSLRFVSYGKSSEDDSIDVLKLKWLTKQVCLDVEDDGNGRSGWGFITWFILIAFMGTAAYLIFGSWLNYNRYGARGWDLLPHGDTIRDLPYLFREWARKVIDTVQGGGSRGGYSAV